MKRLFLSSESRRTWLIKSLGDRSVWSKPRGLKPAVATAVTSGSITHCTPAPSRR
jgi:hypothetical protein